MDGFLWLGPGLGFAGCVVPGSVVAPSGASVVPVVTRYGTPRLRPNAVRFWWGAGTGEFAAVSGQMIRVFAGGYLFAPLA